MKRKMMSGGEPPMYSQQNTNEGWGGRKSLMKEFNQDLQMEMVKGATATSNPALAVKKRTIRHR